MNRETMPDEATQAETYRTIVEAMNGDPVTIRVLDWGGEKDIEALAMRRPRAGDRRRQPGAGPARHPPAAAAAGAAGDPARRHPARRDGRAGAGAAADGDHGRRGARGAGDL